MKDIRSESEHGLMPALGGTRVLELCGMVAGPYCGKLLADLGAEVIKIEEPGTGDDARAKGPFLDDVPHLERSALFLHLNTNKRSVTLNLEVAAGKRIFSELVKEVDILIEDRPPGAMAKLGFGYEVLSQLNPGLIITSITPFGQSGPYRQYKAYHLNIYHASGAPCFAYGEIAIPGRPHACGGGYVGEYDAGLCAATGALAALLGRATTGKGQHVEVSKWEAMISLERIELARHANDPPKSPMGMVGGLMPCKDGWVTLAVPQQHQWEALVKLLGEPEWMRSEQCKDELARSEHREELQPLLTEWMKNHTMAEIYHRGQALGVPVGGVNSAKEISESPQMNHRGFVAEVEHPEAGKLQYVTAAYKYSRTPVQLSRAAPLLGEHNVEIYCRRLGYSAEELATLRAKGVI
jgi:crotonobetainyl-CoA:carnitine CoA-transferase CaiB-like acyl-CoA transferase